MNLIILHCPYCSAEMDFPLENARILNGESDRHIAVYEHANLVDCYAEGEGCGNPFVAFLTQVTENHTGKNLTTLVADCKKVEGLKGFE